MTKTGPQHLRNKLDDTGVYVSKDGKTFNFFEIRISGESDSDTIGCSLYMGTAPVSPKKDKPVFSRQLPSNVLGEGATKIRFKLWQMGSARISGVEVAEIQKE